MVPSAGESRKLMRVVSILEREHKRFVAGKPLSKPLSKSESAYVANLRFLKRMAGAEGPSKLVFYQHIMPASIRSKLLKAVAVRKTVR